MVLSIEYFDSAGTSTADGVFIPVAAMPGVLAAELAAGEAIASKEAKSLLGLLNQIYTILSPSTFNKLGFTAAKSNPAGAGLDIVNQSFTLAWQKLVNLDADTIGTIPVPGSGANSGLGGFSIVDVFPNAAVVAASGAVSGAGVVIASSAIESFSSLVHAGINATADSRAWFAALFDHFADATIRSATVASAVTATSRGAIASTGIPAAFTATTDPTSGILAAELPYRGLITRSLTYTVQLLQNQSTQTFDVRVVTA